MNTLKSYPQSTVLALAVLVAIVAILAGWPAPLPAAPAVPAQQIVMGHYDPIAIYRERDRTLVVTARAGRDLLVCLGDERNEHCKLVEEWRAK